MRTILFVAALSVSGIALAQTPPTTEEPTQAPTTSPDTTVPDPTMPDTMPPSPPTPPVATTPTSPPPDTTMPEPPTPPTPPATATTTTGMSTAVEPGNTNPEKDARGIPVISAPAAAPAGANQPPAPGAAAVPSPNQSAVFTTQPSSKEYPPCSKTVTDNCVQTYEGRRRRR